jgi:hypothetical protein
MKRTLLFLALLLTAIGLLGFQTGAYYEFERLFARNSLTHDSGSQGSQGSNNHNSTSNSDNIAVNTIFNYGNGTFRWSNGTKVPKDWNLYNLTFYLTGGNVQSEIYNIGGISEHQVLGLNGVQQDSINYWSLWKFCPNYSAWAWAPVGADEIALSNNGIYGWYFQNQAGTQYAPVPHAATVTIFDTLSC